jgi:hypothetical protein
VTIPTRLDILQKVAEAATESAGKQYDDYSKTFVALDAKAQAATTLGGVLLGAIIALANAGKLGELLRGSLYAQLFVTAPIIGSMVAMVLGVQASRVASVSVPFDAERQIQEFDELMGLGDDEAVGQSELIGFHTQRHKQWKVSLKSIATAIATKGDLVRAAQWAVVVAAFLTVLLFGAAAVAPA